MNIRFIQDTMTSDVIVANTFAKNEIEDLKTIVRISLEVSNYLRKNDCVAEKRKEFRYNLETIASGVDSFVSLTGAFRVLNGVRPSELSWETISGTSLRQMILSMTNEFIDEPQFLNKCRLLLDLFRLETVLFAISYE